MRNRPGADPTVHNKKVLIIAFYFPPAGGVGTFRVAKFVEYLPRFGWQTAVITAVEKHFTWLDRSLERNIPQGTHIHRLPVCGTYLINDKGIRWIPYVLRSIKTIVRQEKPAVVYITGGPFFPFILGPIIKLCFGIPYVIDLRDPWRLAKHGYSAHKGIKQRTGKLLIDLLEPFIIRHASKIICTTEPMRQAYMSVYKKQPPNKFITITNGFDPEDVEAIVPMQFDRFTIVYAGKWYIPDSRAFTYINSFFKALRILIEAKINLRLIHVGLTEPKIVDFVKATGTDGVVVYEGPKSYNESIAYAKGANLLLFIDTRELQLAVKLFDYIGCKRPILALAPEDGVVAEIIRQVPFAKLVSDPNPTEIANLIREIYQKQHLESNASSEPEFVRRYHREHLTRILAASLDEVIGAGGKS